MKTAKFKVLNYINKPVGLLDIDCLTFSANWDYYGDFPEILYKENDINYVPTQQDVIQYLLEITGSKDIGEALVKIDEDKYNTGEFKLIRT